MAAFEITVTETIAVTKRYTIEAESREEALEKAAIGDTVAEEEVRQDGVTDRDVDASTLSEATCD